MFIGQSILDEIMCYPAVVAVGVSAETAALALSEIGFTDEMIASSRDCLSGGWKMKLLIIRAMLCKADILLLDEVLPDAIHALLTQLSVFVCNYVS